ncbi:glutathione S-transferase family protein [Leptospira idonii]|uniref:Glutathione S-transferase family protein n=1 Tax=Leptospira idonii TaxID=1193500 RepID=A0A4R9LZ60_9LEPT|nr:glutathione S-transferase family protein [Leptospira idonii]TGN19032.1 glutathione S-transferase family protein [Leptospira idonii]
MKIYGMKASGNCYKIQLLSHLLNLPYEWIETDGRKGETKTPAFLEKNPNGKVPIIELKNGEILKESNAILFYLAEGSEYSSKDLWEKAKILEWMFFEQYSHEPYIATNRWIIKYLGKKEEQKQKIAENHPKGVHALQIMESHLKTNDWFVGNRFTIADIALFAYTHKAEEGEYDLKNFPRILEWIQRVSSVKGFVPQES